MDYVDFYKDEISDAIDDPGILFVNMLLMGDRQGESGALTSGFDGLWGAGRVKWRKFDSAGMDAPWAWGDGFVCVDNGSETSVSIGNPGVGADVLKVVAYWFDPGHESNGIVDNVDIRVDSTNFGVTTTVGSSTADDNKERVFLSYLDYRNSYTIVFDGVNVTDDSTGCGSNSMKVYYAYFYEDSARNDGDGPGSEIDAE